MKKELICIICPRGCNLSVNIDGETIDVKGNGCKRGIDYAINECTNPLRTITSIIRLSNREGMVSVKTSNPIKKEDIFSVMKHIRNAKAAAPIKIGDVLIENICGCDIIATGEIE